MQAWNAERAPDQMLEMSVNLSSRQFSELDLVSIVAHLDGFTPSSSLRSPVF